MRSPYQLSFAAVLWLPIAAAAALSEPPLDGVVVQQRSTTFSFDFFGGRGPPVLIEDAYRGIVEQRVIRDSDGTYDFLFHITLEPESFLLGGFTHSWQTPASFAVAHNEATLSALPDASWEDTSSEPSGPRLIDAKEARFFWSAFSPSGPQFDGTRMSEAVLLLDTDARAYADNGTYQLIARYPSGDDDDSSPLFAAFAPAIPEPETYALMLAGLGIVALSRRRLAGRR